MVLTCRFEEQEAPGSRSFFTEIIASISDIKFSKDGRYILSRDYMTLKVWIILLSHSYELQIINQKKKSYELQIFSATTIYGCFILECWI